MTKALVTAQIALVLGTGALLPASAGAGDGPAPGPSTIPSAPRTFHYSSGIQEWLTLPPSRLDERLAAETRLWFGTTPDGLAIAGDVDGPRPRFPDSGETVREGDHVVATLALTPDLELPALGWGNQFGEQSLAEQPCDALSGAQGPELSGTTRGGR